MALEISVWISTLATVSILIAAAIHLAKSDKSGEKKRKPPSWIRR
jgi:hypothetical protein